MAPDYKSHMPKRAANFCPPVRESRNAGCYIFSPVSFEFFLGDDFLKVRIRKDDGSFHTIYVDRDSPIGVDDLDRLIRLGDASESKHAEVDHYYTQRLNDHLLPFVDFYHNLIFIAREESPFEFWIMIYLGGMIETNEQCNVILKHPTNALSDHPYIAMDGLLETGKWLGTMNIGIKPLRKHEWVEVSKDIPLCQLLGYSHPVQKLEVIESCDVSDHDFNCSLEWYTSDSSYRRKPGKYQREIGSRPQKS